MTQHTIVGRFGTSDKVSLTTKDGEVVTIFDLFIRNRGLEHGIGRTLKDLNALGIIPSELGIDMLILAAHVYAADTRVSRSTESQDTWTREIRLVVPVSNPNKWKTQTELLERMLKFLTGDMWNLDFRSRPQGFGKLAPLKSKARHPSYDKVALFSGGLDSLIGAIDSLQTGNNPLFISHAGEGFSSAAQANCFDRLKQAYPGLSINRLRLWMSFPNTLVPNVQPENTMRGRSFLFIAIGVFAASGFAGEFTLTAPENGLIAINVPLDQLRLGAMSTRTMHPFYLARWNELLTNLGLPGRIENPYWDKTKGEMVLACLNQELARELIPLSLSCSSPAKGRWQGHGAEHCGYCLPCLIRRAALEIAFGRGKDLTSYGLASLRSHILDTRQAKGQQIRSFQVAIEQLQNNPGLHKLWIHKPGPLSDLTPEAVKTLEQVYRRGMQEVATLLKGVRTHAS